MSASREISQPFIYKAALIASYLGALVPGLLGLTVIASLMRHADPTRALAPLYAQYIALFVAVPLAVTTLLTLLANRLIEQDRVWLSIALLMLPLLTAPCLLQLALR